MTEEIILHTPATGFPDLEIKIAYGLALVGIEAGANIELSSERGYYKLKFSKISEDKFNKTFLMLSQRLLSSDRWYNLGVKSRWKTNYPTIDKNNRFKVRLLDTDLVNLYNPLPEAIYSFDKEKACRHARIPVFGSDKGDGKQLGGLILLASFHAGKPYKRNKVESDFNMGLCEICGYLITLGFLSFSTQIHIGKGRNRKFVSVVPIPYDSLNSVALLKLLSSQKVLNGSWLSNLIPLKVFSLGLLAKFPSLCDILKDLNLYFHLSLLSKDSHGDTVVEQTQIVDILNAFNFIDFSPYNASTIERLLGTRSDKHPPKISSLTEITLFLENRRKEILMRFVRFYTQETSTLLYQETSKYLLKEVAMISSTIVENKALGSLARTLRYFVRKKKYGYADDIRNARKNSTGFEETIAKMLREGRLRLEQQELIHLPNEDEIKEIFRLANTEFDQVKTVLAILAFSFSSTTEKEEVVIEISEEVQDA